MSAIGSLMTANPASCSPETPIRHVAQLMIDNDCGQIPVVDSNGKPLGVVTDRDIAVRAVAAGAAPTARVVEFLSRDALVVRADDDLKAALDLMSSRQVRRLPVVDKDGRLVGVVSLGDLSTRVKEKYAGEALEDISRG